MKAILFAAGSGTRLQPLTEIWPKCLMPIGHRPLLEYWLEYISNVAISEAMVNLHFHSEIVESFLQQERFEWVRLAYEEELLGTAGTLKRNYPFLNGSTILAIHADNWCVCDFEKFIQYHRFERPEDTVITMMTFETDNPESSGIVELDSRGVVIQFHEKIKNPPANLANGAVFIIEPEVLEWMMLQENIFDFSRDVIPNFLGKIATWKNHMIHKDIGTIEQLKEAQNDLKPSFTYNGGSWQKNFLHNPIHKFLD